VLDLEDRFTRDWEAQVLAQPPLIAPARQFTYPLLVPGEEDAMARGALRLTVKPSTGATFLATCALGFTDPSMPTGLYGCPNPKDMCAVAGGYAYIVDTLQPERCTQIALKPVASVHPLPDSGLLLFVGFHAIVALGSAGVAWKTQRLSWEGVQLTSVEGGLLNGLGWEMISNRQLPFTVDLATGAHTGGGFNPR
jgi:hypothetical protein